MSVMSSLNSYVLINISFDWNLSKEGANLRAVRNTLALVRVRNTSHLSSLLLLYLSTNWSWSQASPLMTRGDKRQVENSGPSGLLRKLYSVGLSVSRSWQNAVRAKQCLGSVWGKSSPSAPAPTSTLTVDIKWQREQNSEQALHRVSILNPAGQHMCILDWNSAQALTSWHCYLCWWPHIWAPLLMTQDVLSWPPGEWVKGSLGSCDPSLDPIFLGWGPLVFN